MHCIAGILIQKYVYSNQGIWTKDLKMKSNLQQIQVTKILKTLESRQLIKAVKTVANKNRKVYMLYELEPSAELTGGAWYTENEFDSEFIEVLRQQCLRFIVGRGKVTLEQMVEFVASTNISTVALGGQEVRQVIQTLVYDGKVDQQENDGPSLPGFRAGTVYYKPTTLGIPDTSHFTSAPCGVCPVFGECHEGGVISPSTCVYFQQWLDF